MVWHGSSSGGQRHDDGCCEAWRVGERALTGVAAALAGGVLTAQSSSSCSSAFIVLCIENSYVGYTRR